MKSKPTTNGIAAAALALLININPLATHTHAKPHLPFAQDATLAKPAYAAATPTVDQDARLTQADAALVRKLKEQVRLDAEKEARAQRQANDAERKRLAAAADAAKREHAATARAEAAARSELHVVLEHDSEGQALVDHVFRMRRQTLGNMVAPTGCHALG